MKNIKTFELFGFNKKKEQIKEVPTPSPIRNDVFNVGDRTYGRPTDGKKITYGEFFAEKRKLGDVNKLLIFKKDLDISVFGLRYPVAELRKSTSGDFFILNFWNGIQEIIGIKTHKGNYKVSSIEEALKILDEKKKLFDNMKKTINDRGYDDELSNI